MCWALLIFFASGIFVSVIVMEIYKIKIDTEEDRRNGWETD